MRSFARFAWGVLAWNVAVVVWGAFVRATGSGAGCGKHWPMCNGEVAPRPRSAEMAIEFTHRATSGVALLLVVALAAWAWRAFPRGHAARRAALASLGFMVVEALVGAALVLMGWVAKDASAARAAVVPIHLANTFLLLGAIALAAWWAERPPSAAAPRAAGLTATLAAALACVVLAGASGAIAALGDTLFPVVTLGEGLRQDLDAGAHFLLRLRALHPVLAGLSAVACALAARAAAAASPPGPAGQPGSDVRRAAAALVGLVAVQVAAGALNLALLAPVWLQLVHLVLADLVWLALVLLAAAALAAPAADSPRAPAAAPG